MTWFLVQGYAIQHEGGSLPGFGGGWGGGPRPDQGLPGYGGGWDPGYGQGHPIGGYPGNRPPGSWGGRPDQGLPGGPPDHAWRPGHRPDLPGQGLPPEFGGHPGQGLPGERPDYGTGQPIVPGATPYGSAVATAPPDKVDAEKGAWVLVDVRGTLVWAWAQVPKQPATPDQGLPGGAPPTAGTLPGQTPQPKK